MTTQPSPPLGGDAITTGWMRQALGAGGAVDASGIAAVAVERLDGTGEGPNAFGSLFRCRLFTDGGKPAVPESVIVKLPETDPLASQWSTWHALHTRELDYYRHVAPHAPLRSPAFLYGHFDPDSQRSVLVLEDLRHMEARSQLAGVEAGQARLAVREIAKLHGQYWDSVDRPPVTDSHDTLRPGVAKFMQTAYVALVDRAFEHYDDVFLPERRRLVEAFGWRITAHFADVASGPRTFVHGDYRADNLFFGANGAGGFAAIDWQASGIGAGLYDLALLLGTSVAVDDRRRIEREALEEYHDIVCRRGATGFTFDDCWRSYRQNLLGALQPCVIAAGAGDVADPRIPKTTRAALERILTATEDLDAWEFLPAGGRFPAPRAAG